MQLVRSPAADALIAFLKDEVGRLTSHRHRLALLAGECTVDYQGRAKSSLSRGERLVVMKADGSFLVHGVKGVQPINWMPPGGTFQAAVERGDVVLSSHRAKPMELVRVKVHACHLAAAFDLKDPEELVLFGLEADLAHLLAKQPELIEPGFVPHTQEKASTRGYYDIYGADARGRRVIVEVKRVPAGLKEAQQLWRYVEREREALAQPVRGILVAPRVSEGAKRLLADKELEYRIVDWEKLAPRAERLRKSGQVTLDRFGAKKG